MKTIGIIQARSLSSRLPMKVFAPLCGRPLLDVLVTRLGPTEGIASWWLATTAEQDDDVLAAWGKALGLKVFRGSVDDVLARFLRVLEREPADRVVRITADDPFTEARALTAALAAWDRRAGDIDIMADHAPNRYPLGFAPHVVSAAALRRAAAAITDDQPWHRLHAGVSWLLENGRCEPWPAPPEGLARPDWRWTVDTAADLEMAAAAFTAFGRRWPQIAYADMVALLDQNPHIVALNRGVAQKASHEG